MAEARKKTMKAKEMLKEHGEKGTVIKWRDRKTLEVLEGTQFYKKGQIITPHRVMADQLIKDGIAKEVKS